MNASTKSDLKQVAAVWAFAVLCGCVAVVGVLTLCAFALGRI